MALTSGSRLGPYEILSPLGAGGMGEVYRASDTRLGREVAIKVLPPRLADDADALARFEREARAVAALSHPNILAIHDFGRDGAVLFAVTELLEGETLRERLSGGALTPRRAVEYALQIAHGLAAAHGKGIVHRDLKPDNIFLTRDGRVKILDFGLAKSGGPAESGDDTHSPTLAIATEPGMILGTVGYMSPEQVRGLAVDARSDIFSFGAVFYEMLTGKRAFQRDTAAETMTAILKEEPPEVTTSNPNLSPALDRIVRHCLEKAPEQRFESARDLAFSLETLSDRSVTSKTPFPAARRNVPLPAIAAAIGIAVVAALAGAWIGRAKPSEPPRIRYITSSGRDSAPSVSPDGRTVAFASDRDGRFRIWLKQLSGGAEVALTPGTDNSPRFSPDGASILFSRTDAGHSSLYRIAAVGGDARKVVDDATEGDLSPDARKVAFVRALNAGGRAFEELDVADSDGSHVRTLVRLEGTLLLGPRWSPDGSWIACSRSMFGNNPADVLLVSADGKKSEVVRPPALLGPFTIPAFAGSGREIVYPQFETTVGIIGGSSSRLLIQKIGSATARTLAWLPGMVSRADIVGPDKVVADSLSTRGNLREVSLSLPRDPDAERWLTRGNSNDRQPSFSPDGEEIVFSSNRGGNLDIWVMSTRTGAIRPVTDDASEDWDPCFTRDGKGVLWSSNRTGHFEIWTAQADGSGARQVTHSYGDSENPVISADGKWIAYAEYSASRAGVWKCRADGSESSRVAAGSLEYPEISPDGEYIAATEFGADPTAPVDLRVYRFADGKPTAFHAHLSNWQTFCGRDRWLAGGKSIAFTGMDERNAVGIFAQEFDPGRDTTSTRRPLLAFDRNIPIETFGFSPDGKRLIVEGQESTSSLLLIEGIPGITPPRR